MATNSKNRFLIFLKDKNKKGYFTILKECLYLWVTKKEIPFYYFKHMYKKETTNYKDYLSTKECARIQFNEEYHKKELITIIANKLTFSMYCSQNNLPVPELISHNLRSNFIFKGELSQLKTKKELFDFYTNVFNNTTHEYIFVKPLSLFGGKGCYKLGKKTLKEDLEESSEYIINNSCIHEEAVKQHSEINKIHPNCVNTIRIEVYTDTDGKPHVLSALMRFGIGKSHVDNSHAGGFFVSIDLEKGTLKEKGQTFMQFGGNDVFAHPDNGFVFKDFKLPYFQETIELVIKASKFIPDRYIGWDIAISETGPVIIEANERSNVYGADRAFGGYKKLPIFKDILEETKNTDLKNAYRI